MSKTLNFNVKSDPKLACTCRHPQCTKPVVKQDVLDRIQQVRTKLARPLIVKSGGRCKYHTNEVKRSIPADHQKCIALDIAVSSGSERGELVKVGIECGFNAIGVAKGFVHLGYREGEPLVIWVY